MGFWFLNNVVPPKKELDAEKLKKSNEIEHSESSIMKTFKIKATSVFNKGNLVFNAKDKKLYKVVDLKTDDSYKPVSASLVVKNGDDKIDLTKEEDFEHFRDYVELQLVVKPDKKDKIILNVKQKLYDKMEDSLGPVFSGLGDQFMAYKLFYKSKALDKAACIAQLDDLTEGDCIFASEGLGKPYKFNRFKSVYTSYGWSNSGNYPDGIAFIPNQPIKV